MITYESLISALTSGKIPSLESVSSLRLSLGDTLIACVGFEDRSLASLELATQSHSAGFRLISVEYRPEVPENRRERYRELARQMNVTLRSIVYDRERPEGGGSKIVDELSEGTGEILLDVSGMSRLLIVQCIVELARRGLLGRVRVFYTEAKFYSPSREEFARLFGLPDDANLIELAMMVSMGVFGLTIVPELSSISMAGCPMHVAVFPSWNPAQLAAVRSDLQATYYTMLVPASPDAESEWKKDAVQKASRVESLASAVRDTFLAPVLDTSNTIGLFVRLYTDVSHREKIVVVPTGSKVQSVCVGLFRAMFSDVQIVYPTPRAFAKPREYTSGIRQSYVFDLSYFSRLVRQENDVED